MSEDLSTGAEAGKAVAPRHGVRREKPAPAGFDRCIDGLNRLPRPLLAFGSIAVLADAMVDPVGFGERKRGLRAMPEPLWWLLGSVVACYFGARESHYFRNRSVIAPEEGARIAPAEQANAALEDWQAGQG